MSKEYDELLIAAKDMVLQSLEMARITGIDWMKNKSANRLYKAIAACEAAANQSDWRKP